MTTTSPPWTKMIEYADLVKFEHTIFALPFALSSMLLSLPPQIWPSWLTVLWILLAMVGGRTYAMALNRLIDAEIDGQNPRTQNRSIPGGRVKKNEAWGLVLLSAGMLTFATFQLPLICQQLLPVGIAVLTIYSYVKRFSSLAHLVLGVALGSSAVGGWLAVTGELSWLPVIFGLSVMFWVAGFDIIYACQDVGVDRTLGLHSLPVKFGVEGGLFLSRCFHLITVGLMILFGVLYPWTGLGYWFAVLLTIMMLIYEHRLVSPHDLSKVNEAFFAMNGRISVTVFVLVLLDHLAGHS